MTTDRRKEGKNMEISIKATPEEITALVVAIQERRKDLESVQKAKINTPEMSEWLRTAIEEGQFS